MRISVLISHTYVILINNILWKICITQNAKKKEKKLKSLLCAEYYSIYLNRWFFKSGYHHIWSHYQIMSIYPYIIICRRKKNCSNLWYNVWNFKKFVSFPSKYAFDKLDKILSTFVNITQSCLLSHTSFYSVTEYFIDLRKTNPIMFFTNFDCKSKQNNGKETKRKNRNRKIIYYIYIELFFQEKSFSIRYC